MRRKKKQLTESKSNFMNNYFSIANNILTGSLRPWSAENQDEEKFRHLLNHKLRQNKDNPTEFCRSALNAFTSLNFATETENLEELKELAQVEVTTPTNIEIPPFFNKQTEFYLYLINNTFQCLIAGIIETVEQSDEIDATYKLYQLMSKLESLIGIISNERHTDKATNQILDSLKLYLFVIHSTLTEKFNSHINFEVLSKNELLFQLCPELESEKDNKSKLAYYLNQYISQPEQETEDSSKEIKSKPHPEPERVSFESFRYKGYDNNYDNLTNLYNSLKKNNFIADDTDSRVFKKVFSGKAITKPVVWTGNPSEFSYFIKLIYTINQYVDDLKQRNWEVACRCFVQADGTPFDRSKLRTLKKPQRSYKQLELAVDNLK
jgi:hypothetical protein